MVGLIGSTVTCQDQIGLFWELSSQAILVLLGNLSRPKQSLSGNAPSWQDGSFFVIFKAKADSLWSDRSGLDPFLQ